jgi:hypothetical protein
MGSGVEGSPFSLPSNKKDRDEQGSNANLRLLLIGEVAALTVALPTAASAQASHDSVALGSNASVSPAALSIDVFPSASLKPCASRYVHASSVGAISVSPSASFARSETGSTAGTASIALQAGICADAKHGAAREEIMKSERFGAAGWVWADHHPDREAIDKPRS